MKQAFFGVLGVLESVGTATGGGGGGRAVAWGGGLVASDVGCIAVRLSRRTVMRSRNSWIREGRREGSGSRFSPLSLVKAISSGPVGSEEGGPVAVVLEGALVWVWGEKEGDRSPLVQQNWNVLRGVVVTRMVGSEHG